MLTKEHPILSEKFEDQVKSEKWLEEHEKRILRNKQIGDEAWKRDILPMIQSIRKRVER